MITPREAAGPSEVARHYDELDPFYRELWGEHLHHGLFEGRDDDPRVAAERLVDLVAELARVAPGDEVVDIGCGYGAPARRFAARGARVTGLTLSGAQLARAVEVGGGDAEDAAAREVASRVQLRQLDWMQNGFPDASFDVAVAIESLAHMPDKTRFFEEVGRTLRPGGRLVVCAWLASEEAGSAARRFLLEPICRGGELPGLGTASEYEAMAVAGGVRVVEMLDLTRQVERTWSVSARRLTGAVLRRPTYRKLLWDRRLHSRRFAMAVLRIRLAYAVGAMRYGVLIGEKGGGAEA